MAGDSKWYFTAEQLASSPSRKCGMDADQELMYRQRAANLIQDMGQRLQVSQLCINTAIVYMHRFYAFHSFTQFHRNSIAAAALFLAAKVEEQPRKLEHIIKVVHISLKLEPPDPSKESYTEQAQDLVFNENVLLQTLGFDVAIDHPHTHVVKTCHLVKASKDLAQTSYFMASNSLHLTTMCLQYKPTVVACFCIHLACKWSRWEIPQSTEGRYWFHYVDKTVTMDLLKQLTDEFLHIFDRCPTRLKSNMKSISESAQAQEESGRSGGSKTFTGASLDIKEPTSSSSHHRSSSHSHHSHSKTSSSGDSMLKSSSQPATTNHKHQSTSSSAASGSSSRSRSERPASVNSQPPILPSGQHIPHGSSSNKPPSVTHHNSGNPNSTVRPSSSSSSQRNFNLHETARESSSKNRSQQSAPTASGLQLHNFAAVKLEKHPNSSSSSGNTKQQPHLDKNQMKTQSSSSMNLFSNNSSSSQESVRASSSSSLAKQSHQQYSQPPSYSQSISNRNSMQSQNDSISVPTQQQKQHASASATSSSESSFRLLDDSNRLIEPMQMCTPPKQSKQSSIFSPEWKDSQNDTTNITTTSSSSKRNSNSSSSNSSNNLNVKPNKDSPSSNKKHQTASHQNQDKQRSETPKKERRSEMPSTPSSGSHQKSSEKKSSSKRLAESSSMPADLSGLNELSNISKSSNNQASKRPFNEQIKQDDGIDFREMKVRKLDQLSPLLDNKPFGFDPFINDRLDGSSMSSFISFNESSSMSHHLSASDLNKPGKGFSNTINGIETNPDLVSSLLKESLCTDSKFGTLNNSSSTAITALPTISSTNNVPELNKSDIPELISNMTQQIASNEINLITDPASMNKEDDHHRSKSEKKKKKEKHKHKDKSKDKEDRKKHKKDKERHKDKDSIADNSDSPPMNQVPIKIKLPKDKLNLPQMDQQHATTSAPIDGLKIKIPKDRLSGSSSLGHNPSMNAGASMQQSQMPPTNSLKLKISKDKIENYNVSSQPLSNDSYGGNLGTNAGNNGAKKKERERSDKDREKSKSSKPTNNPSDYSKQNGNNSNGSNGGGGNNAANSRSSNANKIQQQHSYNNNNNPAIQQNHHQTGFDYMPQVQQPQQQQQQYYNHYTHQQQQQQQQQQQPQYMQHPMGGGAGNGGQQPTQQSSRYTESNSKLSNNGNAASYYYNNSNSKK